MSQPFAVFDIDGTLIRWQLYHAIVDEMASRGHLDQKDHDEIRRARMSWKKRSHESSYNDYEVALVHAHNNIITKLTPVEYVDIASSVFEEYKDQVYTFTRDLIRGLKAKGYLLFAISGSQIEIIEILAKYYGFDEWAGSIYHQKAGKYTGTEFALRSKNKVAKLEEMVKKFGAKWEDSIGIGDTESDIFVLEKVETPIAFNPTAKLFEHAKQNDWQVVVERKNVIYKLEANFKKYTLKD